MKVLICGKGGCGKSTVAALLATAMQKRKKRIFLVDADESNMGLYRMLGLNVPEPIMDSLGGKKGFQAKTKATGMMLGGPPELFPANFNLDDLPENCIASSGDIRVMSVGKIHHFGEGCACPMGKLFRMLFSSISPGINDLVIVDTAAGVEHFGRSLDGLCDVAICIVDPSYESVTMAKRVAQLAAEAKLPVSFVLNKITDDVEEDLKTALKNMDIIGVLPDNRVLFLNNFKGKALNLDVPQIESVCNALEKHWV